MKIVSILLLLISINVTAQRVEFNDPDLTFSFVKPSEWKVEDGPTVFVIPENESVSNPTTFFSITYFEDPEEPEETATQLFDTDEIEPSIPSDLIEFKSGKIGRVYIGDETALSASYYHTQNEIRVKAVSYVFMKMNQRFELRVSAPIGKFEEMDQVFQSILNSLIIKK